MVGRGGSTTGCECAAALALFGPDRAAGEPIGEAMGARKLGLARAPKREPTANSSSTALRFFSCSSSKALDGSFLISLSTSLSQKGKVLTWSSKSFAAPWTNLEKRGDS